MTKIAISISAVSAVTGFALRCDVAPPLNPIPELNPGDFSPPAYPTVDPSHTRYSIPEMTPEQVFADEAEFDFESEQQFLREHHARQDAQRQLEYRQAQRASNMNFNSHMRCDVLPANTKVALMGLKKSAHLNAFSGSFSGGKCHQDVLSKLDAVVVAVDYSGSSPRYQVQVNGDQNLKSLKVGNIAQKLEDVRIVGVRGKLINLNGYHDEVYVLGLRTDGKLKKKLENILGT